MIWVHSMPFRCLGRVLWRFIIYFIVEVFLCVRLDSETMASSHFNIIHAQQTFIVYLTSNVWTFHELAQVFFWCNTESDKNAFFFLFFFGHLHGALCNDLHFSQHHHRPQYIGYAFQEWYCWCLIMKFGYCLLFSSNFIRILRFDPIKYFLCIICLFCGW